MTVYEARRLRELEKENARLKRPGGNARLWAGRDLTVTERQPLPKPIAPSTGWSMDFVSDGLGDGRRLRCLTIVDDCTRECLAIDVDTSLTGRRVVAVLDRLLDGRGAPAWITVDHGPEFEGQALDAWAYRHEIRLPFIRPGTPVETAYIESFNGKFRDECLNEHWFVTMEHARRVIEQWLAGTLRRVEPRVRQSDAGQANHSMAPVRERTDVLAGACTSGAPCEQGLHAGRPGRALSGRAPSQACRTAFRRDPARLQEGKPTPKAVTAGCGRPVVRPAS